MDFVSIAICFLFTRMHTADADNDDNDFILKCMTRCDDMRVCSMLCDILFILGW